MEMKIEQEMKKQILPEPKEEEDSIKEEDSEAEQAGFEEARKAIEDLENAYDMKLNLKRMNKSMES
jgi:hypothetical protein